MSHQLNTDVFTCSVCATEAPEYIGYLACGHQACATCVLVQRALQRQTRCMVCKADAKAIVCSSQFVIDNFRAFEARNKQALRFDSGLRTLIHSSAAVFVERLQNPPCPDCSIQFQTFDELRTHLDKAHGKAYCNTCLRARPCFKQHQILYKHSDLHWHLASHSRCKLCSMLMYDNEALTEHLRTAHVKCDICAQLNVKDSFWTDRAALIEHYHEAHHQCPAAGCREAMIAFVTRRELLVHIIEEHPQDYAPAELLKLQKELEALPQKAAVNLGVWDEYEMKYSLAKRQQIVASTKKSVQYSKAEDEEIRRYIDDVALQGAIKRSKEQTHDHHQADSLGIRHHEFVEQTQQAENRLQNQIYRGMKKRTVQSEATEDYGDQLIEASPVVRVNNINTLIKPHDSLEPFIVKKPAKKTKRELRQQAQSCQEGETGPEDYETTESMPQEPAGFFEEFKAPARRAQSESQPQPVQFFDPAAVVAEKVSKTQPGAKEADAESKPQKVTLVEVAGMQIIQKKAKEPKKKKDIHHHVDQPEVQPEPVQPTQEKQTVQFFKIESTLPKTESKPTQQPDQIQIIQGKAKQPKKRYERHEPEQVVQQEPEPAVQPKEPTTKTTPTRSGFCASQLRQDCLLVNVSTFDKLANEFSASRYQDGKVVATLTFLCKYQGRMIDLFKNTDKNQYKQQEKLQKIAFYTKRAYGDFLTDDHVHFTVSGQDQEENIRRMLTSFATGNAAELELIKNQYKSEAHILVLDKNTHKTIGIRAVLVQNRDEYKFAELYIQSLRIAVELDLIRISHVIGDAAEEALLDKLNHYQKHSYCPWHIKNPAKCTADWINLATESFSTAKDIIVEEAVQQPVEQKPDSREFVNYIPQSIITSIQEHRAQQDMVPESTRVDEEIAIQKKQQKQRAKGSRETGADYFYATHASQPVEEAVEPPKPAVAEPAKLKVQQKEEPKQPEIKWEDGCIIHMNCFGKWVNEIAIVRLWNGKIAGMAHAFVQNEGSLNVDAFAGESNLQNIPLYTKPEYKEFLKGDQFHRAPLIPTGSLDQLKQLIEVFATGSALDLQSLAVDFKGVAQIIPLSTSLPYQEQPVLSFVGGVPHAAIEELGLTEAVMRETAEPQKAAGSGCCGYHKTHKGRCSLDEVLRTAQ